MSRSVKLDTEALRAAQARAQQADRISHEPEADVKVLAFINARTEYVQAARGGAQGDNDADYYRWQGHMEARRQLADMLGYTPPYEPGEKAVKK